MLGGCRAACLGVYGWGFSGCRGLEFRVEVKGVQKFLYGIGCSLFFFDWVVRGTGILRRPELLL